MPLIILLVADSVSDEAAVRRAAGRNNVLILGTTSPDQQQGLPTNAVRLSVDGSDIRSLERRIETSYQSAQSAAFGTRWRDEG